MSRRLPWILGVIGFALLLMAMRVSGGNGPGTAYPLMKTVHLQSVDSPHEPYNTDPPTSGPHVGSAPAEPGYYDHALRSEQLVHNLEHGQIVIYYGAAARAGDKSVLKALQQQYPERVVVVPSAQPAAGLVLTAWGRILRLEHANQRLMEQFIKSYSGRDNHGG
jgi:hypothetical protein